MENGTPAPAENVSSSQSSFTTYSNFDSIADEKVIAIEDLSQDTLGDFPAKLNKM